MEQCDECKGWGGAHIPTCSMNPLVVQHAPEPDTKADDGQVKGYIPERNKNRDAEPLTAFEGVWLVWQMGNDGGEAVTWHNDPVAAIKSMSHNCPGYGRIDWWRTGETLDELVNRVFGSGEKTDEPEDETDISGIDDAPEITLSPTPTLDANS
jgi:hypothetical protein